MIHRRVALKWQVPLRALILLFCLVGGLFAQAQNLPPKPDRYITDQAGILDAATLSAVNAQLARFEQATSNQIVVAIYPKLPPDADIAQYATMAYHAWGLGQKGQDNGALLFIFVQDRKMFIATGRGLEGALPDAICKNIITQVITPQFRQGNYAGGIQAGINAIFAATRGEYKGTGTTVRQRQGDANAIPDWVVIVGFILFFLASVFIFPRFQSGPFIFTSGGFGGGYGGGGGFGGGGGGGDSGGFSGGGGDSAGGGAGGSW